MKKLKLIFFILVFAIISMLPLLTVNAASVTVPIGKTFEKSDFSGTTLKVDKEVTDYLDDLFGDGEGTLSLGKVNYSGNGVSVSKSLSGNKVTLIFTITDEEAFTTLTVSGFVLNGTPKETPTPTENSTPTATATATSTATATPTGSPDGSPSASPTSSSDASPTPDGSPSASPSSSPDGSPDSSPSGSPTSSAGVTASATTTAKVTAKPTKRPSTSERTNDPYNRNWETQAPPTLPPEVTMKPHEIATPVPELETEAPAINSGDEGKVERKDPLKVLTILFLVLVLLLAIDIYAIYWRKRMGYETMINNGISRRKVQDFCDYPEDALPSDLEQAIMEDAKTEEEKEETEKESE